MDDRSYANAAQPNDNGNEPPVAFVPDDENNLPNRPLTAFLNPRGRILSGEVFKALREAGIDVSNVSCIQRNSSGEIVLTFRKDQFKEQFLRQNVLNLRGAPFVLQDVDKPLTYLQIFDAPHELPDTAIINRLAKYCDVIHHRRGKFRDKGWEHVMDGVRHYRVRIKSPIPNFLRFGRIQIFLRYEGQPRTCCHCNQTGHMENACYSQVCFNCEQVGHLASACPTAVLCNICKSEDHKAKDCPLSWSREVSDNEDDETDITRENNPSHVGGEEPAVTNENPVDITEQTTPSISEENPTSNIMEQLTPNISEENPANTPEEEKQIPSEQVLQTSIPASEIPLESKDDFKSIPEEDPMSSASSEDSLSEGEETSAEIPNCPESPKELPQRSQTLRGARKPAKMPDVHIPLRQLTQPTRITPKPKTTYGQENTEPNIDSDENTQQLFPNTGESSAPKRKKSEHSKKTKSKKKRGTVS